MTKYVSKQIAVVGAKGAMEEWLRTEQATELLSRLKKQIPVTCKQAEQITNYTDGIDLDLEVTRLCDQLIEMEVLLEQVWVQLFGPCARIAYDFMRGDIRTDTTTRDTMSDFIASAAPSRAEQVAITRRHLK